MPPLSQVDMSLAPNLLTHKAMAIENKKKKRMGALKKKLGIGIEDSTGGLNDGGKQTAAAQAK